ncbi:MAG: 1,4-alpha-glucan branching protein GlgB [Oscillospiraceae bacterium]
MEQKINDEELYLFGSGKYLKGYEKFGAHMHDGGTTFTVWAPGVLSVRVAGAFNSWRDDEFFLSHIKGGVWSAFVPCAHEGELYKYVIETKDGEKLYKADPFAFSSEVRPGNASKIASLEGYEWRDSAWLKKRRVTPHFGHPLNIYEVHLGSWRRPEKKEGEEEAGFYSYRETADMLVPYAAELGYTHIELMPLTEHPFDGSWGYQTTGYFAATSRYGTPQDLMYLVDKCHRAGIGVIMDWVPGHFCRDAHGLGRFNGEKLYEIYDHKQWGTYIFDFGRPEVRSFLISSAIFWMEYYHIDAVRVDGVSSMLYLNFAVDPGEKRLNKFGGEANLEAVDFIRELNAAVAKYYPDVFTIAEESTSWPLVTYPPYDGGLGFHYKWDMGWMNDTLTYISTDFGGRGPVHNLLTFSMMYAFSENFILPLSHDEVVHGKRSIIGRMPGSYDENFAGVRLLLMYQICHPGAKLTFMGSEFGQFIEWKYYEPLEWFLLDYDRHRQLRDYVKALNRTFLREPSLWEDDRSWNGYRWTDSDNSEQSVLIFERWAPVDESYTIAVLNFRNTGYGEYRIGVPEGGAYKILISTNSEDFGGTGYDAVTLKAEEKPMHGRSFSVNLSLPPLGGLILKKARRSKKNKGK